MGMVLQGLVDVEGGVVEVKEGLAGKTKMGMMEEEILQGLVDVEGDVVEVEEVLAGKIKMGMMKILQGLIIVAREVVEEEGGEGRMKKEQVRVMFRMQVVNAHTYLCQCWCDVCGVKLLTCQEVNVFLHDTGGRKTELYIPPAPPDDEESLFTTMAAGINFDKYDEIAVEVTGRDPPQNITTFEQCDFYETTMKNVKHCNYIRPTPVQKYAIPIIMSGRDLMACAQTGSGKTVSVSGTHLLISILGIFFLLKAAFLLPVITRLIREKVQGASQAEQQSPQVLIISPTRELTMQIYGEARKFVHESIYRPVVIYGGTSVGHQLRQLESGCNILVGTPGRLVDFLNRKKVSNGHVPWFYLSLDSPLLLGFVE